MLRASGEAPRSPPQRGRHHSHRPTAPSPPLALQEHTGASSSGVDPMASLQIPTTGMAKGLGSSGGSATLQRSKLSNKQAQTNSSPKLDDGMGGGGIGKGIFNGGGGDGDGGDDDDYYNEFGEQACGEREAEVVVQRRRAVVAVGRTITPIPS